VSERSNVAQEQRELWNGPAGDAWVEAQQLLDDLFRPFERLLAEAIPAGSATRVLDVGCGTGATTLAAARRLGPGGSAVGVDLSAQMVALARTRAAAEPALSTSFVEADAQAFAFEPRSFDVVQSRFGVMFFDDPVSAFTNLRRATREAGRLRAIVWRSAAENPFMTTAERAAAPLLPEMPARRLDGPGQFAFADRHTVESILHTAGWDGLAIEPLDTVCSFPASALGRYAERLGPVGVFLRTADPVTRDRVARAVRDAFTPFVQGTEVRFTAACWLVTAAKAASELA
jgi:SAM-dependent methyltransferase